MIRVSLLNTGFCQAPAKITQNNEGWAKMRFPALAALIEHPREGFYLFDTGYSWRFHEATRWFPQRLYRWITPVTHSRKQGVAEQLVEQGISPAQIRGIFISHFHADHLGGLRDFPEAKFICSRQAFESVRQLGNWAGIRHAFLPALMPEDFVQRATLLNEEEGADEALPGSPFPKGVDLFGEGSLIAISLPGHAVGHMGLLVDRRLFLIGDAAWSFKAIREKTLPHVLANLLIHDRGAYAKTLFALHQLSLSHPEIVIQPYHDDSGEKW